MCFPEAKIRKWRQRQTYFEMTEANKSFFHQFIKRMCIGNLHNNAADSFTSCRILSQ